jgi:hypothetical protein
MRGLLIFAYLTLTAITSVSAMLRDSLLVGASALAGSLLCFFAVASFCASFLAKREQQYKAIDLLGIGAVATLLTAAGFSLMIWSGFWISLYGIVIDSPYWALIGVEQAEIILPLLPFWTWTYLSADSRVCEYDPIPPFSLSRLISSSQFYQD